MIPKLAGIGAILLWSSLALLTAASGAVPPFELAALTFAVGGGLGLIVTAARGRLATLRQPWPVWPVGVGGLFGYHALYFAALRHAPPAQAGLIAYLWPLLIVLLSAALPGHRLSPRHLVGAALGLGGVGLLVIDASSTARFDPRFATGYALAFVCAFVWSGYSVLSRRFRSVPTEAVTGFCLVTAALATIAHRATEVTVWPESGREWAAIVALGLGPVGSAFFLWDHRRQARRHPRPRGAVLRCPGPLDPDPGSVRLRATDREPRRRLWAHRRRRGRRLVETEDGEEGGWAEGAKSGSPPRGPRPLSAVYSASVAAAFGFSTMRPRYMPLLRSTWWGRRSSPRILVFHIGRLDQRVGRAAKAALHGRGFALRNGHGKAPQLKKPPRSRRGSVRSCGVDTLDRGGWLARRAGSIPVAA